MIALCSLRHSGAEPLLLVLVQREQGWCCTQWLWFFLASVWCSQLECLNKHLLQNHLLLCLVRKVCSYVWPTQTRMVATVQCVKTIFQISVWKMNVWSDEGWRARFCTCFPFIILCFDCLRYGLQCVQIHKGWNGQVVNNVLKCRGSPGYCESKATCVGERARKNMSCTWLPFEIWPRASACSAEGKVHCCYNFGMHL